MQSTPRRPTGLDRLRVSLHWHRLITTPFYRLEGGIGRMCFCCEYFVRRTWISVREVWSTIGGNLLCRTQMVVIF